MKNETYDKLKATAQLILPLIATFIASIFEIWGIPYGMEISATIMAIDTLLGGILMKASKDYSKSLEVSDDNII